MIIWFVWIVEGSVAVVLESRDPSERLGGSHDQDGRSLLCLILLLQVLQPNPLGLGGPVAPSHGTRKARLDGGSCVCGRLELALEAKVVPLVRAKAALWREVLHDPGHFQVLVHVLLGGVVP